MKTSMYEGRKIIAVPEKAWRDIRGDLAHMCDPCPFTNTDISCGRSQDTTDEHHCGGSMTRGSIVWFYPEDWVALRLEGKP